MSELVEALEEFAGELAVEGYEGKFNLIHQAAERIAELEAGLEPFSKIKPSTCYPEDGSENEAYDVILSEGITGGSRPDFTGAELARARALLKVQL